MIWSPTGLISGSVANNYLSKYSSSVWRQSNYFTAPEPLSAYPASLIIKIWDMLWWRWATASDIEQTGKGRQPDVASFYSYKHKRASTVSSARIHIVIFFISLFALPWQRADGIDRLHIWSHSLLQTASVQCCVLDKLCVGRNFTVKKNCLNLSFNSVAAMFLKSAETW